MKLNGVKGMERNLTLVFQSVAFREVIRVRLCHYSRAAWSRGRLDKHMYLSVSCHAMLSAAQARVSKNSVTAHVPPTSKIHEPK